MQFIAAKIVRSAVIGSLIAGAGVIAATAPAGAGTNGQHVSVCTADGSRTWVDIWGTDHNGNFAQTKSGLGRLEGSPVSCTGSTSIWFKGALTVRWHRNNGDQWETHHNVPISMKGDVYTIGN